jgi:predicted MFS family arabinose efflux permease
MAATDSAVPFPTRPREQVLALRRSSPRQRRAIVSGWAGYWIDMVDVYLPLVALAPAIAYFQPAGVDSDLASVLFVATFAATMLGRPLGALIFGQLADRLGRRRLTLVSIAGFSTCTAAIGVLPGFAAWGAAAPVVLVALRFVNGVFLGGEYSAGTPLAFEQCPPRARGLLGGLMLGAYAIAYVFLSLVVLGVLAVAPAGELASPYVQWGWRIPFLLGALVGFLLLLFRARVPESDTWQRARKVDRPLKTLVGPALRRDLAQVLLVMTGLWLMSGSVASFMPRVLLTRYDASATAVTSALLAAHVALLVTVVLVGMGSQVVGRRAMLVLGAGAAVLLGLPLYAVVVSGAVSPAVAFLLAGAVHVFVVGAWGAASSYCNERFPTAVRSSGFGIGYSVSLVLPSLSPLYVAGLGRLMPFEYTPLVLLVIGAALLAVGALRGPETADVDLTGFDVDADGALPTLPTQRGTTTAEVARL